MFYFLPVFLLFSTTIYTAANNIAEQQFIKLKATKKTAEIIKIPLNKGIFMQEDGKWLELVSLENQDYITTVSFRESIQENHNKSLPWVLAAIKQKDGTRDYFDAHQLNKFRFSNSLRKEKNVLHPVYNNQYVNDIGYYQCYIENEEIKAEYIGNEQDLLADKNSFLRTLFFTFNANNKNEPAKKALLALGDKALRENKLTDAQKWYMIATRCGILRAANNLGNLYAKQQNYETALQYFKKASTSKNKQLQKIVWHNLGIMYEKMNNNQKAIDYYTKSAEAGHPEARLQLLYLKALGKEFDETLLNTYINALFNNRSTQNEIISYKNRNPEKFNAIIQIPAIAHILGQR